MALRVGVTTLISTSGSPAHETKPSRTVVEYRYASPVVGRRDHGSSGKGLQVMAHPPFPVHSGDHGLSQQDRRENLRVARVDQEVGAEV